MDKNLLYFFFKLPRNIDFFSKGGSVLNNNRSEFNTLSIERNRF